MERIYQDHVNGSLDVPVDQLNAMLADASLVPVTADAPAECICEQIPKADPLTLTDRLAESPPGAAGDLIYEVVDWRTTIGDVRRDLQEFILPLALSFSLFPALSVRVLKAAQRAICLPSPGQRPGNKLRY